MNQPWHPCMSKSANLDPDHDLEHFCDHLESHLVQHLPSTTCAPSLSDASSPGVTWWASLAIRWSTGEAWHDRLWMRRLALPPYATFWPLSLSQVALRCVNGFMASFIGRLPTGQPGFNIDLYISSGEGKCVNWDNIKSKIKQHTCLHNMGEIQH